MSTQEYNNLPKEVKNIVDSFDDDNPPYPECVRIGEELRQIGWSCMYGLDGMLYNVEKKITTIKNSTRTMTVLTEHNIINNNDKVGVNVCTNAMTTQDKEYIDQIINLETKRKIVRVDPKNDFGIITACMIDGEFILSSCHDVPTDLIEAFKNA